MSLVLVLGAVGVLFLMVSYLGTIWALLDAIRHRAAGNDLAGTWVVFLAFALIAPPLTGLVGALYGLFGRPRIRAEQEQREQLGRDRRPGVAYATLWALGMTFVFVATGVMDVESEPQLSYGDELQLAREQVEDCLGTAEPGEPNYGLTGMKESDARRVLEPAGWRLRVIGRDSSCEPERLHDEPQPNRVNVHLVDGRVVWAREF